MFIFFSKNICAYKKTQIAPFLIAIIAVVIAASLVFINIAKIGIFKTDTENAADAAALAGSSVLGTTLLGVGKVSDVMFGLFLAALAALASCRECTRAWLIYITWIIMEISSFIIAVAIVSEGSSNAEDTAKLYAFNNSGIDEIKPHLKGESYEDWLRKRSRFEIFIDNQGYKSGFYSWRDRYGDNWFKVRVDGPHYTPVPLPVIVIFLGSTVKGCCVKCYCGPLPGIGGIASVSGVKKPLRVWTERYRSDRDFGLWKAKYGVIKSYSEAKPYGGSVMPLSNHLYDSKLERVE